MTSIVDSHRPGRRLPPTNRFADSSDDEDEEERRLLAEEEEQERILSEQHGEAEESTANRSKRQSETDDIEAEYGIARKRVKRPTLTPAALLGPKGLIRIRSEFHRQVRWPSTTKRKEDAAAAYSRSLIRKYKSFCYVVSPGSAFEDMLTRIESFGSKKEVKTYLQSMRDEIRNNHLENVYGKEKANRMIQELEHGLRQQHEIDYEEFGTNDGVNAEENEGRRGPVTRATSNPNEADLPRGTNASVNTDEARKSQTDKSLNETVAEKELAFGDDLQDTDDELEIVAPRNASSTRGPLQKPAPTDPFDSGDEKENEETESQVCKNKAKQENVSISEVTNNDMNTSDESPADNNVGPKEPCSSSDPEDEDTTFPTSSDETATIVATMETQLESPEQKDEVSRFAVQENPSTLSGALSLDETVTIVATEDSQLDSPEQKVEKDEPFARNDPWTPTREQEPPSTFDETATIVATINSQLDSPRKEDKREEPFAQVHPLSSTQEKELTSSSDETATIVATMSTMDTQLDSPLLGDMLEAGKGSSSPQKANERQSQ